MSVHAWLKLPGTRYRCVPLYLPLDELDPLSRLFLEVLQHEHQVARLVNAFGLTERVVEDVLGDLIRRNRAALVIQGGAKEIWPVADSLTNVVPEPGEPLDVWQDHATGLVLPAWIVDPYDRPRGRRLTLGPSGGEGSRLIADFVKAPDSQLIGALVRADPNLQHRRETYSELDRLADRYRMRPQIVWLPVVEAQLQGQKIPMITAERIPGWMTRVWSTALRRGAFGDTAEIIGFHAAATTQDEGIRIMHGWRAITRVEEWREAVDRFLRLVPAPISGYDLREVREREAAIRGTFLSIGQVELLDEPRKKSEMDWLQPVFDSSRDWGLLVLPWPGLIDGAVEWLKARVEADASLPNSIIFVLPPTVQAPGLLDTLRAILGPTRFPTIIWRQWPSSGPSLALGDSSEARALYSPRSSVIRFSGMGLAAQWLSIVKALPAPPIHPAGKTTKHNEPLRQLRIRPEAALLEEEATLGLGGEPRKVAEVVNDLRVFGESLLTAIVDPQLLITYSDGVGSELTISKQIDRKLPLIDQLPHLLVRCNDLCYNLLLSPTPPWTIWAHLTAHELVPVLAAILTEPGRRTVAGEIHILVSSVSEGTLSVVDLLEKAIANHGWVIQIGLPKTQTGTFDGTSDRILSTLRGKIPSPRLRFWAISRATPTHALVIDDLVFIAGGSWLGSILQQPEATDFGFAIESRELAESLRSCFTGAEEILPVRNL